MKFTEKNIDQIIENLNSMRDFAFQEILKRIDADEKLDEDLEDEYDEISFLKESEYLLKIAMDCIKAIKIRSIQHQKNCFHIIHSDTLDEDSP